MIQNKNNLLWIGTIVNTHALKGEVRVLSDIDNIYKRFSEGEKIFFYDQEKNISELTITGMRLHKQFVLLTFQGIQNINDIEWIKGHKIYGIPDQLEENEYFLSELLGKKVYNNNQFIGTVSSFMKQGSYDSMIIDLKNGKQTNIPIVEEFEVKYDREEDIVNINVDKNILGEI